MKDNHKSISQNILVLFIYLAIYVLFTFPLILDFDKSFLGKGDANIHVFNLLNYNKTDKLFYTEFLFYPLGQSTIFHTSDFSLCAFASLFDSPILGMNMYLLLTYGLSGLGAFLFSKRFFQNNIYCFICGFIFAFSSYKTTRLLGHYNLVLSVAIPFLMILFLQLYHKEYKTSFYRNNKIVLFCILFLFSILNDYVVTICFLYFMLFYFFYFVTRKFWAKLMWSKSKTIFAFGSITVIFHLIIKALVKSGVDHNGGIFYGGDLLGFILPYNHFFIKFPEMEKTFIQSVSPIDGVTFIGYILLLLFVISFSFKQKKFRSDDKIAALIFVLISLFLVIMPQIRFLGKNLFYSPFAIHHFIPFVNQMRAPIRVFYIFIFIFSIVTFYNLLNSKWSDFFNKKAVSLLILSFIFLEYYPEKYPINNIEETEEVYFKLKEKPGESVLILPFGVNDGLKAIGVFDMKQLSNIFIHQKKIYGGHMSRISLAQFDFVNNNEFLKVLCELETDQNTTPINYLKCKKTFETLQMDYFLIPDNYNKIEVKKYINLVIADRIISQEKFDGGIIYTLKHFK